MKIPMNLLFTLVFLYANAQTDIIETNQGELKIHPVIHATLVLEWNGLTIYVDPYSGADQFAAYAKPDLILITDIHSDHLDLETLKDLETAQATFIVPAAVQEQLGDIKSKNRIIMNNGEKKLWEDITIEAVPMYNLPESKDAYHVKGRGNGYILNLDGTTVYLSGDTEGIPEMRKLENIDIAFLCMNLPYTMNIDQATEAVLAFEPDIVYPYHYRNKDKSLSDVAEFKKMVNKGNPAIDVRLKDWYPPK